MKKIFVIVFLGCLMYGQSVDCVGSSITRNGYPGYSNSLMRSGGYVWNVYNYGVPGAGVVQSAYKNTAEYEEVICREAEIVVLLLGANDWRWYSRASLEGKNKWKSEYEYLINKFRESSIVVLGYLIHRVPVNNNDVTLANATMDEMNVAIGLLSDKYGLAIIDFKTAIGTNPDHFWPSDGLHPSRLGSEKMGIVAYDYLKQITSVNRNVKNCPDNPIVVEDIKFNWVQIEDKIHFTWDMVDGATRYNLKKAYKRDVVWYYPSIDMASIEYWDSDFILGQVYYCNVRAYKNNVLIGQSLVRSVQYYEYLGIEDDEYWEAVKDYEEQRKIGWFGCSAK